MAEQPPARSGIRRLVMVLAGIFLFCFLILAGTVALIQSDWGKRRLVDLVSSTASTDSFILKLEGLSGVIPFDIRLDKFSLADAQGVWLSGEDLAVKFSVLDLLTRTFRFPKIFLHKIVMTRAPQSGEESPSESEPGLTSPDQIKLPHVIVNELLVDQVILAPPLTDSAKVFTVKGAQNLFGSRASVNLDIISQEGPAESLNLSLDLSLVSPSPVISLKAQMEEAAGGLLGEMLDFSRPTAISARIEGDGPLTDWSGRLSVVAADTLNLDTGFKLGYDQDLTVDLSGTMNVGQGFLPEEAEAWVGREASYRVKAKWGQNSLLTLDDVKIVTPKADLKLKGDLNLEAMTAKAFFVLKPLDLSYLKSLSGVVLETGRIIEGQISGPVLQPVVNLKSDIGKVEIADLSVDNLMLDLEATTTLPLDQGLGDIKSRGRLILTHPDVPPRKALPQKVSLTYELAIEDLARLNITSLDLDGGWLKIKGDFRLAFDDLAVGSAAVIEIDDLTRLAELGVPLSGRTSIKTSMTGLLPDRIETDIKAGFEGLGGLPAQAALLLSKNPSVSGQAVWDGETVFFKQLQLKGKSTLTADGRYEVTRDNFDLKYEAVVFGLAELVREYNLTAEEPAQITGQLTGPAANLGARAEVRLGQLTVADRKFSDIRLQVEASDLTGDLKGRLELGASTGGQTLSARTQINFSGPELGVKQFQANIPGAEVTLDASIDTRTLLVKGKAYAGSRDLSGPGRLFGLNLGGGVALHLRLASSEGKQGAEVEGKAHKISIDGIRIAELNLMASTNDLTRIAASRARIRMSNIVSGEITVKNAAVDISGAADSTTISAKASGAAGKPFSLQAQANIREKPGGGNHIQLKTLELKYDRLPVKLARPAELELNPNGWNLSGLDLQMATGKITGRGNLTPENVSLDLATNDLPLKTLSTLGPVGLNGNLSSRISISGRPSSPRLEGDLKLSKLGLTEPGAEGVPLANLDLKFNIDGQKLNADLSMSGLGPKPGRARASLPVEFSMKPFQFNVPDSGLLSGKLEADLDLSTIPAILNLDLQTMAGQAKVNLTLAGNVAAPRASGTMGITSGRYENVRLGVILQDITTEITAEGPDIRVSKFSATDGGSGRFKADGSIQLDPDRHYPYQLKLDMDRADLVRLDLVSTRCTGNIDLSGTVSQARVSGQLTLDPTNINIPKKLPGQITELQVTQINGPPSDDKDQKKTAKSPSDNFRADLNVSVDFPGRFFVRGEGLTSEWKGNITVAGNSAEPVIKGKLDLVRGSYDFLSKRFQLTQGALTFDGAYPPSPYFDVTGEVAATDITAKIIITGSVSAPNLALESEPVLPQDEILARVLFGKDLSDISPVQALSLAKAALQLTGEGPSGPDLMDKTRKMLHLDQLQFKTGASGDTAIGAGKYLGDRIYVEAQGGMTPEDQKVTVQIELLPRVNLETEVGADSTGSVGLNWKLDY